MTQLAAFVGDVAELLTPCAGNADVLSRWIVEVRSADLPHLCAFARGLVRDRDAMNAALTLPYSNGPTKVSTPRPSESRARCTAEQASPCSATARGITVQPG